MKTTKYGNFSPDGKEFILTEPLLDRPWMNVLSNGKWCYVASHLGGGYSFVGNPTVSRVTRWHIDGVPRDTVGKFVYLRDEESGNWWTANGYPPVKPLDAWRCHIGLGYNRIVAKNDGIESEITYFTPMPDAASSDGEAVGDPCEIWIVKLTNTSKKKTRKLSATNYCEIALGNWYEDTSWREFYLLFNRQDYQDGVIYTRSAQWIKYIGGWQACNDEGNNIPYDQAAFLASSAKVVGYEGERYEFIGSYRDLANPQAMDAAKGKPNRLRSKVGEGRDACHALQHRFTLKPGESVEYVVVLGTCPRQGDASELVAKYADVKKAKAAFANNQAYWTRVTSTPMIETPDVDVNNAVNYWFKYQGANLSWWNRNTGYCYFGIYNFGVRDACQDAVSRLPQDPKWVRDHVVKRIMIWQFEDGDYAHGGNFVSMVGTRTHHSDDPINPLFILSRYCKETGDYTILDEVTPYAHTKGAKTDTVYAHIIKGLDHFWTQFNYRGLPKILKADWNDALDQVGNRGIGDSSMLGFWVIICLEDFFHCMEKKGDTAKIAEYRERLAKLKQALEQTWDGDWYQRAMHDDGTIIGTKTAQYARIWADPNSFAIVAKCVDDKRQAKILASFDKHLDHPLGSYCFYPPYGEPDPKAGIISRFYPGTKENGAIFGHCSRWRIWAELHAGRGDKAYEILHKMLPATRHEADAKRYRIEPYAACQFITAPESGLPGEGSHSWATGTAAWTLIVVWEHLLGVRTTTDGLLVDPCMPSKWTKARMKRAYRGATYDIRISKPKGICSGKVTLTLDGTVLPTNVIPPQNDGKTHVVEVAISA